MYVPPVSITCRGHVLTVRHPALENLSRVIHRSTGKYPLTHERRHASVLSEGDRGQEVQYPGAMDTITTKKQENRFYTYPEWRKRMLQKCLASGRHGSLTPPAWKARSNPHTGVCDLPQKVQKWWENDKEEEEKREKMSDEEENEPVSMTSDAEWEGWRRELAVKGPIRPGSPGLKAAQEGNPWTSDGTLSPNRTDFYGTTRSCQEEMRC